MPVLLKGETNSVYSTVDVEALVHEVRERLCLKNRDRFCAPNRRGTPYDCSHRSSVFPRFHKHYSSPDSCSCHGKHRQQRSCNACSCDKKLSAKILDSKHIEDPHVLLEKLLSEQSLIQEAVRRLQSQTSPESTARKFFHFVEDDDSCDQFSNRTPGYSESEDDCVSQHSVDL
ncbi:unnamed protein product [Candidula unifasciata]|uniref:Uncharacterized protein n=1 Tax=Candidula unifasciata TaxID=100452 RepID=A0A8S3YNN4_9EUPU|nr:unnamed protein product [Candidula unifasciata]